MNLNISLGFADFFNKAELSKYLKILFSLMLVRLDGPFRDQEIFIIFFFNSSDLGFERKKVILLHFLVDILILIIIF